MAESHDISYKDNLVQLHQCLDAICTQHSVMMKRSLLQTAISREGQIRFKAGQFTILRNVPDVIKPEAVRSDLLQWTGRRYSLFNKAQSPIIKKNSTPQENLESKLLRMGTTLASRMSTDRTFQYTEVNSAGEVVRDHKEITRSELVSKGSRRSLLKNPKLTRSFSLASRHVISARSMSRSCPQS